MGGKINKRRNRERDREKRKKKKVSIKFEASSVFIRHVIGFDRVFDDVAPRSNFTRFVQTGLASKGGVNESSNEFVTITRTRLLLRSPYSSC